MLEQGIFKQWHFSRSHAYYSSVLLLLSSAGGKTPDPKMNARTYMDVMREQHLTKEEVGQHVFFKI